MLEEIILKTLKYFDVQDHPLTLIEVWKFLLRPEAGDAAAEIKISDIQTSLSAMKDQVESHHGFYFLRGRKEIADARWLNNYYSTPRLRRAVKYTRAIRHIPFVAAVALSGSEALNNSRKESDIDLLVLTEKNRIWLARVFLTAYFQFFGVRRHGKFIKNRFCLNHYVEKQKKLQGDHNIYTAIEYLSLIPFYGGAEIYKFQQDNLEWIKNFVFQPQITEYKTAPASGFKKGLEKLLSGKFGDVLENALGKYQLSRIKVEDYITVEKDELSFHPGSKGQAVLKRAAR